MVFENVRWPGPDVCVEGMAVVSFIVEKDGTLTDFTIRRDPGQGTGKEALRVVKLMAEATAPWVPGAWGKARKPVRIQYNVPVRFRLE
jgi:protein TonB